ncbi:capsid staple protein [Cronobacter sakazakii]|uniref:capsid staple protein n=1 Tax=Cronobacter sakazakii TaxID=28141 RepID=UPI0020775E89|nr:hypothetical protein [Cronobacter sakazakii]USI30430.1 hypothetical protein NES82_10720 [Cronobacter sakazakii]
MKTVNMKTGTEAFEGDDGQPETRDQYPWGLRITLDNDSLMKLGVKAKSLPSVGDEVAIMGMAKVCSVSTRSTDSGEDNYVELQITDIGLNPPKRDDAQELKSAFYPDQEGE